MYYTYILYSQIKKYDKFKLKKKLLQVKEKYITHFIKENNYNKKKKKTSKKQLQTKRTPKKSF